MKNDPLARAVEQLSKLPGIGEKSASRLAIHLLKKPADEVRQLANSLLALKEKLSLCSICFNITDTDPCAICRDPERDGKVIAIVEDFSDLIAVENAGTYRGKYHVLHGTISAIDGVGPHDIKITELIERVKNDTVNELIIATNPTVEGETTAHYLKEQLEPHVNKISRIAYGLPMGGDLQYADRLTLAKSFENRNVYRSDEEGD